MEKQTFEIPKGCSKVTVEQIGNTIVTSFEAEPEFKRGDIITAERAIIILNEHSSDTINHCFVKLYSEMHGGYMKSNSNYNWSNEKKRLATDSEKQQLFAALARGGKKWDADKLEIVDLKYVPKIGDCVKVYQSEKIYNIGRVSHVAGDLIYFRPPYILSGKVWIEKKCTQNVERFTFEQITPEELQSEFNKLGYEYDFETHEATKIRWKPKNGETYYFISALGERKCATFYDNNNFDKNMSAFGNCYSTPEEAEKRRQHYLAFKD